MSFVDRNLISGETILYRTRLHWIVLLLPAFLSLLFAVPAALLLNGVIHVTGTKAGPLDVMQWVVLCCTLIALIILGTGVMYRSSTEMAVTNKRVMMKSGFVSRKSVEIVLSKIESITVDQTLIGRIFGYGTITVRGTGGTPETFVKIGHPLELRQQVQEQIGLKAVD